MSSQVTTHFKVLTYDIISDLLLIALYLKKQKRPEFTHIIEVLNVNCLYVLTVNDEIVYHVIGI